MDELQEFNQLLNNLTSSEDDLRQEAEKIFESIELKKKVHLLFLAISDNTKPDEVRHLATVLLRRVVLSSSSYEEMAKEVNDPNFFRELRFSILELLQKANISMLLKRKISSFIGELAEKFIDDQGNNQWGELIRFILQALDSPSPELKECALIILDSCPTLFGSEQAQYLSILKKMFMKCLLEDTSEEIKIAAIKATISFILANLEDKHIVHAMSETVVPILQVISILVKNGDEKILLPFIELAEKCPKMLRQYFNHLMDLCMELIIEENYSENLRGEAIEMVVTFAENAPGTFRKLGAPYLNSLISQFLFMMTNFEDDEEWSQSDKDDEEEENDCNILGETSLDRLACAIGGKAVFSCAINIVSGMLRDADWKRRYAALMAISALGEGCAKQMEPLLEGIVTTILPYIGDSHPRVRYAVCVALGQMSSDFSPAFQKQFHSEFIPNMLRLISDNQNPRVQAKAGAAFINFFENVERNTLLEYAPVIMDKFENVIKVKIEELMNKGKKLVLEQMLMTTASFAEMIQESFIPYCDRVMPYLKMIIRNGTHKDLRLLRGKAFECATLIGLAVGAEKFSADASDIMELLLQSQAGQTIFEDDDPQLSYFITSWARICKILGPKFAQFLPMVMPQVLKTASMKVELTLIDDSEISETTPEWKFVPVAEDKNLGIKVTSLEEKANACEMLVCYARELKHYFVDYLEDSVKILTPLLHYYLHEGVRIAAAESLPYLLECAKIRGEPYILELWNFVLPDLFQALEKESDGDVLAEMLVSLSDCIMTLRMSALNELQMESLIKIIDQRFQEHLTRSKERQEERHDEDYDDYVEEVLKDEDEEDDFILNKLVDLLHSLFVSYKDKFLPYFNQIFHHIVNLAAQENLVSNMQWAICVIDDMIEHTGEKCVAYQDFFLPLLANKLKSTNAELRQAASYGLGVLAQHGGKTFEKYLADNIPIMVTLIQDPNSRTAENLTATENLISAVTKIMRFNGAMVDCDALLPCWLSWLPIWEDEEEVIYVYSFLYELLERNHPLILGDKNCNVPRIVSIIAEPFARNVIEHTSELGQKLISYIKFVNLDKSIISSFSPEQQLVLEQIAKL